MHILAIEDEERLALLLRRILTGAHYVVDLAYTGATGLTLALSGTYDLVILDVRLPDIDGMNLCQRLRAQGMMVPVLMLTARGAVEDRVEGLTVGADDYLVKPFVVKELLARVHALLRRRERPLEMVSCLKVADLTLDLVSHEAQRNGRVIELTAKEFALLHYLMRHPNQVLTRNQIIDAVWRYDTDALSTVVDNYIHFLREKVDKGFSHPLIKTVRGVGYKIIG